MLPLWVRTGSDRLGMVRTGSDFGNQTEAGIEKAETRNGDRADLAADWKVRAPPGLARYLSLCLRQERSEKLVSFTQFYSVLVGWSQIRRSGATPTG